MALTTEQARQFLSAQQPAISAALLSAHIEQLSSGPIIALELRRDNAVRGLLDLCGHEDPNIARQLHPSSIRAIYSTVLPVHTFAAASPPSASTSPATVTTSISMNAVHNLIHASASIECAADEITLFFDTFSSHMLT